MSNFVYLDILTQPFTSSSQLTNNFAPFLTNQQLIIHMTLKAHWKHRVETSNLLFGDFLSWHMYFYKTNWYQEYFAIKILNVCQKNPIPARVDCRLVDLMWLSARKNFLHITARRFANFLSFLWGDFFFKDINKRNKKN